MQNENKDPYGEKLAYGIAFNGSVDMQGDKQVTIPKYSVVTITGENSKIIVLPPIIRLTMLVKIN